MEFNPKETYQGEIKNNSKQGTGIFEMENGDIYLGEWDKDAYHGEGILISHNGERY